MVLGSGDARAAEPAAAAVAPAVEPAVAAASDADRGQDVLEALDEDPPWAWERDDWAHIPEPGASGLLLGALLVVACRRSIRDAPA